MELPKHGELKYDEEGKPLCHICGKSFKRVLSHVRQKHNMSEKEYKKQFGLNLTKGICSAESSQVSRDAVYKNYDKVVEATLIAKGEQTRFSKGHPGRKQDKVSAFELKRLQEHVKTNVPIEKRKLIGSELGKSGLGNKTRWKK